MDIDVPAQTTNPCSRRRRTAAVSIAQSTSTRHHTTAGRHDLQFASRLVLDGPTDWFAVRRNAVDVYCDRRRHCHA